MLAALLVALSVSAPATLTSAALPKAPILDIEARQGFILLADASTDVQEPGFAEKYFSFSLSPNASPQVKESVVM